MYIIFQPREITFPKRLYERPEHRNIPSYATYLNPMNFSQSVYDMSDLDPRKTYMPGNLKIFSIYFLFVICDNDKFYRAIESRIFNEE